LENILLEQIFDCTDDVVVEILSWNSYGTNRLVHHSVRHLNDETVLLLKQSKKVVHEMSFHHVYLNINNVAVTIMLQYTDDGQVLEATCITVKTQDFNIPECVSLLSDSLPLCVNE
jgi:hypothetical protein